MQDHNPTDQETIKTMAICSAVFVVVTFALGVVCSMAF